MPNELELRRLLEESEKAAYNLVYSNAGDLQQHYYDVYLRITAALYLLKGSIGVDPPA